MSTLKHDFIMSREHLRFRDNLVYVETTKVYRSHIIYDDDNTIVKTVPIYDINLKQRTKDVKVTVESGMFDSLLGMMCLIKII